MWHKPSKHWTFLFFSFWGEQTCEILLVHLSEIKPMPPALEVVAVLTTGLPGKWHIGHF